MPILTPTASTTSAALRRRLRPAAHRGTGAASSMLRLSRSADVRLPSTAALSDWADRAAAMLDLTPMLVGAHAAAGTAPSLRISAHPVLHVVRGVHS